LAEAVSNVKAIEASTYHDFCIRLLEQTTVLPEKMDDTFYKKQVPELFASYLREQPRSYDAVIVDEGQDFSTEYWLNIMEMVKPDGHFYIFYDPGQDIFESASEFPIKENPFILRENCRNTARIIEAMMPYARCDMRTKKDSPAGECVNYFRSADQKARRNELARILHSLINVQGICPDDVVILGGHSLSHTWLGKSPQVGNYTVTEGQTDSVNNIKYYTYMKFKGCESTAVILLDVDPDDPRWAGSKALYTAMGRAIQLLYVISVK
jgi:hypothetical protein